MIHPLDLKLFVGYGLEKAGLMADRLHRKSECFWMDTI
jgi:hypothetical protein